jgi:hypothetical protein
VRLGRRAGGVLGLCALAVVGVAVAVFLVGRGGGSGGDAAVRTMPTTGAFAPITVAKPNIPLVGGVFLGDPTADTGGDMQVVLTNLPGKNHYKLTFSNTSGIGFIDAFQWYPPPGVQVLRVTGQTAGTCALVGLTGFGGNQFKTVVLHPNIMCRGVRMKPPSCTCKADGGEASVSFVATDNPGLSGVARVMAMTPTLKVIPSYVQATDK